MMDTVSDDEQTSEFSGTEDESRYNGATNDCCEEDTNASTDTRSSSTTKMSKNCSDEETRSYDDVLESSEKPPEAADENGVHDDQQDELNADEARKPDEDVQADADDEHDEPIEEEPSKLSDSTSNLYSDSYDWIQLMKVDETEYECYKVRALETIFEVPVLQTVEDLKATCEELHLDGDFTVKPKTTRSMFGVVKRPAPVVPSSPKKKKEAKNYEVEAILDYMVNDNDKPLYLVKWQGWDEEYNSWEPVEHLDGCNELLDEFHDMMNKSLAQQEQYYHQLVLLRIVIDRITSNKYDDPAVFLKLFNITLRNYRYSKKGMSQLKSSLKERCASLQEVLEDDFKSMRLAPSRMHHSICKELKLDSLFGSLEKFLEFVEQRKDVCIALKKWEKDINDVVVATNEQTVVIENNVDTVGPPENFVYITACKPYSDDIVIHNEPVMWCECSDCFETRKDCCPKHMDSEFKYTKEGVLRDTRRPHIVECNKKCKCGPDCPNRVIQKGRQYKLAIFRTDNGLGWGVKTLEKIPKGRFVMEYVGEIIPVKVADQRGQEYDSEGQTYLFDLDFDVDNECIYVVDAAKFGNVAHFVNHSCDPNLEVYVAWIDNLNAQMPRIALFSKRSIKAGEELTFDYRMTRPAHYQNLDESMDRSRTEDISSEETKEDKVDAEKDEDAAEVTENGPATPKSCSDDTEDVSPMLVDSPSKKSSRNEDSVASPSKKSSRNEDLERLKRIECKCGAKDCRKFLF